jgi:hypothetical protein
MFRRRTPTLSAGSCLTGHCTEMVTLTENFNTSKFDPKHLPAFAQPPPVHHPAGPIPCSTRRPLPGHVRIGLRPPGVQSPAKPRDGVRIPGGEVRFLAGVGAEIVEFDRLVLEPLDHLPVAGPDAAARAAAMVTVMRKVPEERFMDRRDVAPQQQDQARAIERLGASGGQATDVEHRSSGWLPGVPSLHGGCRRHARIGSIMWPWTSVKGELEISYDLCPCEMCVRFADA